MFYCIIRKYCVYLQRFIHKKQNNGMNNTIHFLKTFLWMITLWSVSFQAQAQTADFAKMSPMLRQLTTSESRIMRKAPQKGSGRHVCAFIQLKGNGDEVLRQHGCLSLARYGNIHIADIPMTQLGPLSLCAEVTRIEARESNSILLDTTAAKLNVAPIYSGTDLPQAFTGKGVVVGLEDIGFDLTHPTFRTTDLSELRIRRFWDHLSVDTLDSELYVGAEYTTPSEILTYAHSRDAYAQFHGTHTLGIAAGNGVGTPYRGIAWESDICLVSNAVNDSKEFIREEDLYKYTSATDMLGFEYMLNYAESQGKPCVVSFSEGSHQDFMGDDVLMYAVLDSLVGPGRIIVASAGNEGHYSTYLHKPLGTESLNTYITNGPNNAFVTMRASGDFDLAVRFYIDKENPYTHLLHAKDIIAEADSLVEDTLQIGEEQYIVKMAGYPSCYHPEQNAFEVFIQVAQHNFGYSVPVELEIMGADADVEVFRVNGKFRYKDMLTKDIGPGESSHNIYSPGSAPAVICVGALSYRNSYVDIDGKNNNRDWGTNGEKAPYSSVGPTFDDRTKPDVMANGSNVISAGSSYYFEEHNRPIAMYLYTSMLEYDGRQYPWRVETGTSMSTPAVAGTIALWLQAKPDLTPDDVREVLAETCRPIDDSSPRPNNLWGYGEIDAYRGLLYILGYSGIQDISQEQPRAAHFSMKTDGQLCIRLESPSKEPIRLCVYATGGQVVEQQTLPAGIEQYGVSLSHLPQAVYAVQMNSHDPQLRGSTLIRR